MTNAHTDLNLPFDLPDPSPLHYNIFAEVSEGSPDLVIQLKDDSHIIHQMGIPFILLDIFFALPHAHKSDKLRLIPYLNEESPQTFTYQQAQDLKEETIESIHSAIDRTISIYSELHGIT